MPVNERNFDVAIVGGSIAGSVTALLLARAGLKIAVIDKSLFPRRKACGEGLSKLGAECLGRLGLGPELAKLHAHHFDGYRVSSAGRNYTIQTPSTGGISLQRHNLDALILQEAANNSNTKMYLGCEVRSLDSAGAVVFNGDLLKARHVVIADGGQSVLTPKITRQVSFGSPKKIGVTATYTGEFEVPAKHVHVFVERGYELYCTPLPDSRMNINVLTGENSGLSPKDLLLTPKLLDRAFRELHFKGEMELKPLGRSRLGNARRAPLTTNTWLVGDALEQFDPIAGMGMTHAMLSAEILAEAILKCEKGELSRDQARAWYSKQRARRARPLRLFTYVSGHTLRASRWAPSVMGLASSPLGNLTLSIIGASTSQVAL